MDFIPCTINSKYLKTLEISYRKGRNFTWIVGSISSETRFSSRRCNIFTKSVTHKSAGHLSSKIITFRPTEKKLLLRLFVRFIYFIIFFEFLLLSKRKRKRVLHLLNTDYWERKMIVARNTYVIGGYRQTTGNTWLPVEIFRSKKYIHL